MPTGVHCSNFKAEAKAIEEALHMLEPLTTMESKVVILSDARSVLQTLENPRATEISALLRKLAEIMRGVTTLTLQWIPGHSDISGNEKADALAKEGSSQDQIEDAMTYGEAKTIIKAVVKGKWTESHPQHNNKDDILRLDRGEQTAIFRLRTGHNQLRHHLHRMFKIGETEDCRCGEAPETAEHVLQHCGLHGDTRRVVWSTHTDLSTKLYGLLPELQKTAHFLRLMGINP